MKKLLIFSGLFQLFGYFSITAMSKGLPTKVCVFLDRITFNQFSSIIFQMDNGFYYPVNNNDMPTIAFLIVFYILFVVWFLTYLYIEKNGMGVSRLSLGIILFFAVLFRFVMMPGEPIHENDFYRYLWDGKSMNAGINPYKFAPADLFMFEKGYEDDFYDDYYEVWIQGRSWTEQDQREVKRLLDLRDENLTFYKRIGHWQVPTIYPPVAQSVFSLINYLKIDSVLLMKFVFFMFECGIVFIVLLLLKHFNINLHNVIIYAWSPLVIKEFANAGHYDPIAIFFTILSIYFLSVRQIGRGSVAFALAFLSKFFSVVLAPVYFRQWKWQHIALGLAIIIGSYLPYFFWGDTGVKGVFQGLNTYNEEWSYNSSIFALVYMALKVVLSNPDNILVIAKYVVGGMYLIFLGYISFLRKGKEEIDLVYKSFLAIAVLFIINPVGDPWYYGWVMPFLCLFPFRSWMALSGLLMFSYINFQGELALVNIKWGGIPAVSWIIYLPFAIWWIYEQKRKPSFLSNILNK